MSTDHMVVRPLGAFERSIDFSLQERHPLLGAAVDRAAPEDVYRVSEDTIPLETAADGTPWQAIVAVEQTRLIPGSAAHDAKDFRTLSRRTRASLAQQRTPAALKTGSAALARHAPSSARATEARRAHSRCRHDRRAATDVGAHP
ncbi:hypothetical protein [Streptomyces sp. OE57]|uniref:hypothetical protein n=1 Tax=Streptomyces lacaronensis TaxID=3379885 RepID=UPI0039B74939